MTIIFTDRLFRTPTLLLLLSLCLPGLSTSAHARTQSLGADLETVTMQIRWSHQFQFAGYYAALEMGFYRDVGLDVIIVEGTPERSPVTEVLAGRAQYGEANSELLYHYLEGQPLVALAAIFQHSPSVLLALGNNGIHTPHDAIGKKVMMVGGTEDVDFLAMFLNEGVTAAQLNIIPSSYDIQDLIDGKTDLFNAYSTNEPFYLQEQGHQAVIIAPTNYGIDFYSDILFTTRDEVARHPRRVNDFRAATIKGWEYAMSHPDEIIELLLSKYQVQKSRAHLEFEAEAMAELILPRLVPIGNINPGRFQNMAIAMQQFGLVDDIRSLKAFIYDPNPQVDLKTFWQVTVFILLLLIATVAVITYMYRLNGRLQNEVQRRRNAETHFRAIIDNLQNVYYRTDMEGVIEFISPSVESVFGYRPEELIGRNISQLYAPPYKRHDFIDALNNAGGKLKGYELKMLSRNGEAHWRSANSQLILSGGMATGIEGMLNDINNLKSHQERYQLMALHDPLTNLPNRRYLSEILHKVIAHNIRRQHIGALLFIDLNDFKPVNDLHGHDIGDRILIETAQRFKAITRSEDTVARVGGDEFVVILSALRDGVENIEREAQAIAEKIIEVIERPFLVGTPSHSINIGASIGISLFPADGVDSDQLIKQADEAMYAAKTSSDRHIVIYRPPAGSAHN